MSVEKKIGWVPNISGNVCCPEKVKLKIDKIEGCYTYSYGYDDSGRNITALSPFGAV